MRGFTLAFWSKENENDQDELVDVLEDLNKTKCEMDQDCEIYNFSKCIE